MARDPAPARPRGDRARLSCPAGARRDPARADDRRPQRGHRRLRRRRDGRRRNRRARLPQARERGAARVRLALCGGPLAGADPGRHRTAVCGELAAYRRGRRRRADRRVGDAVRDQARKPVYELLGAELGPRGDHFGQAIIVDPNIEEATGTSPDLAVSSTGQADVVYRVVRPARTPRVSPLLHPGDVVEQVRVAHFDGQRWANLGAINRDPGVSMRPPTEANAPKIAIGPTGNGAGRLAGARHRRRRADLGQAPVRLDTRLRDAGQRRNVQRGADQSATPTLRASRSRGWGRPMSPTARTPARARRCRGRGSS